MLSCNEVSRLVSESLDRDLSLGQRLSVRLHLLMCTLCARSRRQIMLLRDVADSYGDASEADRDPTPAGLSAEARERIQQALERECQPR